MMRSSMSRYGPECTVPSDSTLYKSLHAFTNSYLTWRITVPSPAFIVPLKPNVPSSENNHVSQNFRFAHTSCVHKCNALDGPVPLRCLNLLHDLLEHFRAACETLNYTDSLLITEAWTTASIFGRRVRQSVCDVVECVNTSTLNRASERFAHHRHGGTHDVPRCHTLQLCVPRDTLRSLLCILCYLQGS
jgi:hypothetical protein